jgi:hypothetical protein
VALTFTANQEPCRDRTRLYRTPQTAELDQGPDFPGRLTYGHSSAIACPDTKMGLGLSGGLQGEVVSERFELLDEAAGCSVRGRGG